MDPELLQGPEMNEFYGIVATMLTVAITSTGRPFLTLFALFAVPTGLIWGGLWDAGDWYFGETHLGVVAGLGLMAFIEHFLRGSEAYAEMVEQLPWDRLPVLITVWLMFVGGFALAGPAAAAEPAAPLALGPGSILMGGTLTVHFVVAWARSRVLELARDLGVGGLFHWGETFGVFGLVALVVLLPIVAVVLSAGVAAIVALLALLAKVIEASVDRARRRDCPHCGHAARGEASQCPSCGRELSVVRTLAPA